MFNLHEFLSDSEFRNKKWLAEQGRKLLNSGKGIQTKYGLLFVNEEIAFGEVFKGGAFPAYLYDFNTAVTVLVGCGKLTELLELPAEDITIKKSLARLGADNFKDCTIEIEVFKEVSDALYDKIHSFESDKNIFELNNFLKSDEFLNDLSNAECDSLGIEKNHMEQSSDLFNKEVSRVLFQNGFTVSESSDCVAVSLGDDFQVKIYANGMISTPKIDPNEEIGEIVPELQGNTFPDIVM